MDRSQGQLDYTKRSSSRGRAFLACLLLVLGLFLTPLDAWGYRPFVSTDAAVADPKEVEIEFGYFNLERVKRENTFSIPKLVLNYGLLRNVEVVGEFRVERSPTANWNVVDPGLFVKGVVKEGILQEKNGIGFAVEAGPLLPSTVQTERKFGFEGIGILSGKLAALTYHINFGGGVDRADNDPFAVWGVILELPIVSKFRFVGEVNGESIQGERANNSALFGFIWQPTSSNVFLDAGVRRGISRVAPDWQFTMGLTFGFSLPGAARP